HVRLKNERAFDCCRRRQNYLPAKRPEPRSPLLRLCDLLVCRCPLALCCALGVFLPRSPRREPPARGCLYVRNAIHFMIFLFVLFVHLTPRPCARLRCF